MAVKKIIAGVLAVFLMIMSAPHVYADEDEKTSDQLIVVLDCSKSMDSIDPDNHVKQNIMAIAAMLPEDTQVGFVAYQKELISFCPPTADREVLRAAVEVVGYSGYTNAGSGLSKAVSLFTGEAGTSRRILMISDGEIDLPGNQLQVSVDQLNNAAQEAKEKGITIDILALGTELHQGANIYGAAEVAGGKIIESADPAALCQTLFNHFAEQGQTVLGQTYQTLEAAEAQSVQVVYQLPDEVMHQVSLLLVGSSVLPEMTVTCGSTEVQGVGEGSAAIFHIEHPEEAKVTIQFAGEYAGNIAAAFTAEYNLNIKAATVYSQEKKCTEMNVSLVNDEDEQFKMPQGSELTKLQLLINGVVCEEEYTDGRWEVDLQGENKVVLTVELESGYAVYHLEQPLSVSIPLKDRISFTVLYIVLAVLAALCLVIISMHFWKQNKQKQAEERRKQYFPEEPENIEQPLPKKPIVLPGSQQSYHGKLRIYIIRAPGEEDIPPQSIKLLGRDPKEILTLEEILAVCNIDFPLQASKNVLFYPGKEKELILCSYSTATILKNRSLLLEGEKYPLYYHDKITVIFERNDIELEIHYNNIKPSER